MDYRCSPGPEARADLGAGPVAAGSAGRRAPSGTVGHRAQHGRHGRHGRRAPTISSGEFLWRDSLRSTFRQAVAPQDARPIAPTTCTRRGRQANGKITANWTGPLFPLQISAGGPEPGLPRLRRIGRKRERPRHEKPAAKRRSRPVDSQSLGRAHPCPPGPVHRVRPLAGRAVGAARAAVVGPGRPCGQAAPPVGAAALRSRTRAAAWTVGS